MSEFSTTVTACTRPNGVSTPAEDLNAITQFAEWIHEAMGYPLANRTEIDPASILARVIESAVRICEAMADDISGKEEEPTPWD